MAHEEHLARLLQRIAAWDWWQKGHYSVLWQQCASAFQQVWRTATPVGGRGLRTIKDASRKTLDRLRTTPWRTITRRYKVPLLVLGGVLLGLFLLMIIIKVPQRQAASWRGQPGIELKDLPKLENDARTTLIQALGGAALIIGLFFTWYNLRLTEQNSLRTLRYSQQTLDLSRKGQINDRFIKAIEQLGAVDQGGRKKLEVRLGGIYALEQIANDSPDDHHWPIMEILTAYVRENAPWKEEQQRSQEEIFPCETQPTQSNQSLPKLATDVQAILTVLKRRTRTYGKGEAQSLNLGGTDLRKAVIQGAHLEGALLTDAHLEGAFLVEAHLERTRLEGAFLMGAHLEGAFLWGAHLEGAKNLTVEQLSTVETLYQAHLDPPLLAQIRQQYPQLLERP